MKRETITQALGGLDDRFVSEAAVYAPGTMQEGPERIVRMKKKRFLSIVLAAALILALGITAYAAWSIHTARQEEIKTDLKIEENNVSSYAEYPVPEAANSTVSDVPEEEGSESELVLLSAVNAGDLQRVYVNISPVSEKCIADYPGYPGTLNFSWSIDGTGIGVFACGIVGMGSAGGLSSYTRIIRLSDVHGRRRDASPSLLFACRINGCHCFPGGLSRPPGSLDRKRGSWFSRVSRWRPVDACLV